MLVIKIDVTKIPRDKIFQGKKGKYVDFVIFENEQPDNYGNTHTVSIAKTKEERAANAKTIYCGSGKIIETRSQPARQQTTRLGHSAESRPPEDDDPDSVPF